MDAQAFLLKRENIQDGMAALRAYALAASKRRRPWWLSLPILPLAGFILNRSNPSRSNGNGKHETSPLLKSFMAAGAQRLVATLAKQWTQIEKPTFFSRLFK